MAYAMIEEAGCFGDKRLEKRGFFFSGGWFSGAAVRCAAWLAGGRNCWAFAGFLAIQR